MCHGRIQVQGWKSKGLAIQLNCQGIDVIIINVCIPKSIMKCAWGEIATLSE